MATLAPMGDQAILASLETELQAFRLATAVRIANPPWLLDVVQAYRSVAVFVQLEQTGLAPVLAWVERMLQTGQAIPFQPGPLHRIPCCYEFQLDLARIEAHTGLNAEAIIRLHSETIYTVYAIGFCPGFPYLGYLPAPLAGVARLDTPRVRVEAGSVGLTGRQTGIYTESRPGGWNLVGRTPLEMVNVRAGYFPLRTGDRVQFQRIDRRTFERLQGQRLPRHDAAEAGPSCTVPRGVAQFS